jgi:hypothetical protein
VTVSLLHQLAGLIERTYDIAPGIEDYASYVIGDDGYRRRWMAQLEAVEPHSARMLVRENGRDLHAAIYYPNELICELEQEPPQHGLSEKNVDAFATFVEELDHLLLLAWRRLQRRPVSQFELELQANVTKYLVLQRFLSANGRLDESKRQWLHHHLFEKAEFSDENVKIRRRYEEASRSAVKFLRTLPVLATSRIRLLRRFYAANSGGKLELISSLASRN